MSGEFRCFVANSCLIGEYGMMLRVELLHHLTSVTAHNCIPTL